MVVVAVGGARLAATLRSVARHRWQPHAKLASAALRRRVFLVAWHEVAGGGAQVGRGFVELGESGLNNDPRTQNNRPILPHHRLHFFGFAREMLVAVRDAHIRDAKLRDEALRAAKSTCLNCAEGAGRVTRADKARAFTVARGEAVEAAAAVEIAALLGDAKVEDAERVAVLADRVIAMLTRLVR